MSLREFYKDHYVRELARKAELTSALSLPIGIVSVLVSALVVMAKELHLPLSAGQAVQALAIGLSALASLIATYYLIRSLYNFAYGFIATPLEVKAYQKKLESFHQSTGMPLLEAKSLAEDESLEYLDSEYAVYADRNAKNNDIKSMFLHQANGAMIAAILFGAAAGAAYVFSSLSSALVVPKVKVVNLKELILKSPSLVEAATAPPAPAPSPAPSPVIRPTPPPGRIVREDHRPVRPPAPATR